MKKTKKTKQDSIPKAVELASLVISEIDSGMSEGEAIGLTPFKNRLERKDGSHPHFDTVKNFMHLIATIQPIADIAEVLYDEKGEIEGLRKLPKPDITFKKETRANQLTIMNRLDTIEETIKKLLRKSENKE